MKKTLILAAIASSALVVSTQAQSLIAGFDFQSASANYSDLGNGGDVNDGAPAASYGSFSFSDGPGNGFPLTSLGGSNDIIAGLALNSTIRVPAFNDTMDAAGNGLLAEDFGFPGASADGGSFEFAINAGSAFTDFSFGFAAGQNQAGSSDLAVSYSTNGGGSFTFLENVEVTTLTSGGGQAFSIDATGFNASEVIFRVDFTDIDTGVTFDNLQVSGTVVPEPSTYAAIFGAIALAFAAVRRRR